MVQIWHEIHVIACCLVFCTKHYLNQCWQVSNWTRRKAFLLDIQFKIIHLKLMSAKYQPFCSGLYVKSLTHWARDKMATISQTTFSNAFFFNENIWILINISLNFVLGSNSQYSSTGSDNGLAPNSGQSETMMHSLLTHKCVTRPQWVKAWVIPASERIYTCNPIFLTNISAFIHAYFLLGISQNQFTKCW